MGTAGKMTRSARSRLTEHTTTHAKGSTALLAEVVVGLSLGALRLSQRTAAASASLPEAWPRSSSSSGRVRVHHGEETPLALPDVSRQVAARDMEALCEGSRIQQERILCVRLRLYTLCLRSPGKHRAVACGG